MRPTPRHAHLRPRRAACISLSLADEWPAAWEQAMLPTVIRPLTPLALLDHVLTTQAGTAPTTLIVASTRETFLHHLLDSVRHEHDQSLARLIDPTLHNLSTSRHIRVVFCASVQTLLACLTAYAAATPSPRCPGGERGIGRLFLVNPLRLHAPTSSFSAQGLGRTFAATVEAASRAHAALFVVECVMPRAADNQANGGDGDMERESEGRDDGPPSTAPRDPWEQDVSILNVSARRSGSGNADRAWTGRTVTAQMIAARWCRFHTLEVPSRPHKPD